MTNSKIARQQHSFPIDTGRTISLPEPKDRKLLLETRDHIDELLETIDIMSNPDETARIREAERELKEGKGRPLSEFEDEP